jgi:GNAT superfamily N-acetyltransferase
MITVKEIRSDRETADLVLLGEIHQKECASHLSFNAEAVVATCDVVLNDTERRGSNIWVAREDDEPIGYAVAYCSPFYFNFDFVSKLELWYVIPAKRGSWAAIKLVKAFEEWARLNGSVQLYVGVARTDKDEARHIRALFPKLKYAWCGSYYLKEPSK